MFFVKVFGFCFLQNCFWFSLFYVRLLFCFYVVFCQKCFDLLLLLLCSIVIFAVLLFLQKCFDCFYFCNEKCLIVIFSDLFYVVLCLFVCLFVCFFFLKKCFDCCCFVFVL